MNACWSRIEKPLFKRKNMNLKKLMVIAATLSSVGYAMATDVTSSSNFRYSAGTRPVSLIGAAASEGSSTRTVVIQPDTKFVRVVSGQTVKFVSGEKSVIWHFDGPEGYFELAQITPEGFIDHGVSGYIDSNPLYY